MKVVVSSNGAGLEAQASPIFGRCPVYVFVETETMAVESVDNPAMGAPGGAGIQAAQYVVEQGAEAVISGNMGPNAFNVLKQADLPTYLFGGGTVRQAVEAFKAGDLAATGAANAPAHAGMGMGGGMGPGPSGGVPTPPTPPSAPASSSAREAEIEALKEQAGELRSQLTDIMDRLDRLEEGS